MAKKTVEIDQKFKDGYVKIQLKNVKVQWAKVIKPDTMYEHKWSIDALLDGDPMAQELKDYGFNVKDVTNKKTGAVTKDVFKIAKKVRTAKGEEQDPPICVGPDGRTAFTEEIGNGSICNINLSAKAWPVKGEWVLSAYLDGVQVVDHVEFGRGGFEDVSGDESAF